MAQHRAAVVDDEAGPAAGRGNAGAAVAVAVAADAIIAQVGEVDRGQFGADGIELTADLERAAALELQDRAGLNGQDDAGFDRGVRYHVDTRHQRGVGTDGAGDRRLRHSVDWPQEQPQKKEQEQGCRGDGRSMCEWPIGSGLGCVVREQAGWVERLLEHGIRLECRWARFRRSDASHAHPMRG